MDTQLLPVVARVAATPDEHELRHVQGVAQKIAAEEPTLAATSAFGAACGQVW